LIFPPISISVQESVARASLQNGQSLSIMQWMNSAKQENRVHAPLDSDLKSLVSVQFEVISSFWLNFPPSIEDSAAIKRCFRLSKVFECAFLHKLDTRLTATIVQALRDQWDKLIAFASSRQVYQSFYFVVHCV
jgi:hypothetical protein